VNVECRPTHGNEIAENSFLLIKFSVLQSGEAAAILMVTPSGELCRAPPYRAELSRARGTISGRTGEAVGAVAAGVSERQLVEQRSGCTTMCFITAPCFGFCDCRRMIGSTVEVLISSSLHLNI
jgi:hypothetical protein